MPYIHKARERLRHLRKPVPYFGILEVATCRAISNRECNESLPPTIIVRGRLSQFMQSMILEYGVQARVEGGIILIDE